MSVMLSDETPRLSAIELLIKANEARDQERLEQASQPKFSSCMGFQDDVCNDEIPFGEELCTSCQDREDKYFQEKMRQLDFESSGLSGREYRRRER